jgi:hypothetical protein
MRTHTLVAIAILGASELARADAPPDATALFDQGIKDMQAGNTELACKELAASLQRYTDSGTKGALAECYTKLGKVASAWNLWRDLADTAPSADLRKDAAGNAYQLEARLSRFVIRLKAQPPRGLAVTVADSPVADPTLAVPLPVDPGAFTARASAPGYEDWSLELTASEGKTTIVEIPALTAKPEPKPAPLPATVPTNGTQVVSVGPSPTDVTATRHSRHLIGFSLGVAGLVGVALAGTFGGVASSQWSTAQADCGGHINACPMADVSKSTTEVSSAQSSALVATVSGTVGAAALAAGVIVYLTAPSAEHANLAHLRVVPTWSPSASGLALTGGW